MIELTASEVRIPPQVFNKVVYAGERVRIIKRSEVVYLVSAEDMEKLLKLSGEK